MTQALLYLNDFHVQLLHQQQSLLSESALAYIDQGKVITGEPARAQVKLEPTRISSQHWRQLNQAPLSPARKGFRHHADIAYHQLSQWLSQANFQGPITVASSLLYNTEQQALLAGIINATGCSLQAMVHPALLQTAGFIERSQGADDNRIFHLELCLHDAILTELSVHEGSINLLRQIPMADQGYAPLLNRWQLLLAKECVRQTRYDPLHSAAADQRLYDQIPTTLQQHGQLTQLDIDDHHIKLDSEWLSSILAPLKKRVQAEVADHRLLISPLAAALPLSIGTELLADDLNSGFSRLLPVISNAPLKHHQRIELNKNTCKRNQAPANLLLAGHQAFHFNPSLALQKSDQHWQQCDKPEGAELALRIVDNQLEILTPDWKFEPQQPHSGHPQAGDCLNHPSLGRLYFIRLEEDVDGA